MWVYVCLYVLFVQVRSVLDPCEDENGDDPGDDMSLGDDSGNEKDSSDSEVTLSLSLSLSLFMNCMMFRMQNNTSFISLMSIQVSLLISKSFMILSFGTAGPNCLV